jgi:hypothetical protein
MILLLTILIVLLTIENCFGAECRYVFVLSSGSSSLNGYTLRGGALGGLEGADAICTITRFNHV